MSNEDVQSTIANAIQSARYNEAVVVTVEADDSTTESNGDNSSFQGGPCGSREIVLVACLDEENGGIVWRDAGSVATTHSTNNSTHELHHHGSFVEDPGIVRHLRTKRWALPMLNDHRRNKMYNHAVIEACKQMVNRRISQWKEGNHDTNVKKCTNDKIIRILDIGSGTGLLAMMAAKHTLDAIKEASVAEKDKIGIEVQVTSVEMASAMARLARQTIELNNLSDNIVVVETHSTDPSFFVDDGRFLKAKTGKLILDTDIKGVEKEVPKADICTSELLESGLLGEGVLPSIRDAWTRHLKDDAIVVPRRARVFAVLVEGLPIFETRENARDEEKEGDSNEKKEIKKNGSKTHVNSATAFFGPELNSFHDASGGVWLATSPPSKSVAGDESGARDAGVLLGVQHIDQKANGNHADESVACNGGIVVPIHADAMLCERYRDDDSASLDSDFQTYNDEFSPSTSTSASNRNKYRGIRPLTEPVPVLELDFSSGLENFPSSIGQSSVTEVVPTADGVCHGILFWWHLDLWDGDFDTCTYSTEPTEMIKRSAENAGGESCEESSEFWQDHWQQCLFLFGDDHSLVGLDSPRTLVKGCSVNIATSHDDSSVSFDLSTISTPAASDLNQTLASTDSSEKFRSDMGNPSRPSRRRRLNATVDSTISSKHMIMHKDISSGRALQLNDISRVDILCKAILHAVDIKGRDSSVLDLSDMGLCALIAAVAGGATKVTSLESSSGAIPTLAATIAQLGNGLPRKHPTCDENDSPHAPEFQVIHALAENITTEYIIGGVVDIVVAEPYYEMLEGWHLQEALNYFYLVRSLKSRGVIAPTAVSVPSQAHVMACVVQFDNFIEAYGRVGEAPATNKGIVAGFTHSNVNYYGDRYHTYDVSLPMWQYNFRRLSKIVSVAKLLYEGEVPKIDCSAWVSTEFENEGTANAVIFWIDYLCRTPNGSRTHRVSEERFDVISTSTSSHRQVVRKFSSQFLVSESDLHGRANFHCKASFGNEHGGIDDHKWQFKMTRQNETISIKEWVRF